MKRLLQITFFVWGFLSVAFSQTDPQGQIVPRGPTPPATCVVGEIYFDTDAAAGLNWLGCTTVNTWTLLGDGSGVGGGDSITVNTTAVVDPDFIDTTTISVDENLVPAPDTIAWNVVANSIGPTHLDETLAFAFSSATNTFLGASFTGPTADPADAGVLRLSNGETICWEASPTGADFCITGDASERIAATTFVGALVGNADTATSATSATTATTANAGDSATAFFPDQNAGTDLTVDLEEETHVSEHAENGADELLGEALGTACTDTQILKANATGGLNCAADETGVGGGDAITVNTTAVVDPDFITSGTISVTENLVPAPDTITWDIVANSLTAAHLDETAAYAFSSATNTFLGASFTGPTADPADAGVLRLSNGETICWEASPTGADFCITGDSSERIAATTFVGALVGNADTATSATSATTATTANAGDSATAFFPSGILEPAIGGTGNGFTLFSGPATTEKTYTLPNASTTILTTNAAVTAAQGGTGQSTTATLNRFLKGDGTNWGTSTGSASGTGACGANTFASTLNSDAAPTCTQPDFSNLSGTVGDAQIAAGAVDGGSAGEIADGTVDSNDLATANKTITKTINIFDPVVGDSNLVQIYWPAAVTLQRVACSIDTGTSVTIQFDERVEATPNTAGTDSLTSALVCDTDSQITTSFSDAGIAADVPHNLQITGAVGTPGVVRIHLKALVN